MLNKKDKVQATLKKHGPMASGVLSKALVSEGHATTQENARKLIERSRKKGNVLSTRPIRFNRSFLYFLEEHRKNKRYAQAVKKALSDKPSFNRVYKTVLANKGWITSGQIGKASACLPTGDISNSGGRHQLLKVTSDLKSLGIIEEVPGKDFVYKIGHEFGSPKIRRAGFQYKIDLEQELLLQARDWLRNCYLLSYESHSYRPDATGVCSFNQSHWDLDGPIYFGPLTAHKELRRIKTTEDYLVVEILGYRSFGKVDAESLMERYRNIVSRWNNKISLTPVVIAPTYSREAWQTLRNAGVVPVTLQNVFGQNVNDVLKRIWAVLSAKEVSIEQVSEIEKTLKIAQNTEFGGGIFSNLKGILFELIIALAWKAAGYDVTLRKIIKDYAQDESYEIDIVAVRGDECKLIECKGRHSEYRESKKDIERHFEKRCKVATDEYGWNVTEQYKKVEAVFITSGLLGDDANTYANKKKKSHGIACRVMTREKLLNWLEEKSQGSLVKIIKEYYEVPETT